MTAVIGAAPAAWRYVVVSGSEDRGRSHHGAGAFATVDEACEELDRLRLRPTVAWAELTAVDPEGRLTLVCRFDR